MHSSRFVINFIPRIRKDKHAFTLIGEGIRNKYSIGYLAIIMHGLWLYNNKLINKRIGDVEIVHP